MTERATDALPILVIATEVI